MIPMPSGVRVWLAVGRTDMRRGMNGLALQVQEALGRDPFVGDLFVFRGARGDLIKILARRPRIVALRQAPRARQVRLATKLPAPSASPRPPEEHAIAISAAQLAYLLSGIDWRNPVHTFRPERAG